MSHKSAETDQAIVARITGGDSEAYALLMQRYEQKLLRYVGFQVHDDGLAADIVQETFIKAYQNLQSYRPAYSFSSWIYRIAHNHMINTLKRQRHLVSDDAEHLPELSYDAKFAETFDRRLLQKDVQLCLKELENKYKDVIQLVYFEQLKYEDAADVLRVPTSTIGVWLSRAKAKLRVICEQKGTNHA